MDLFGWLKGGFSPGTLITCLTIAGGFAVAHGQQEQRASDLERRITTLESNVVRRNELDQRDKSMVEILSSIDHRLSTIERTLMRER